MGVFFKFRCRCVFILLKRTINPLFDHVLLFLLLMVSIIEDLTLECIVCKCSSEATKAIFLIFLCHISTTSLHAIWLRSVSKPIYERSMFDEKYQYPMANDIIGWGVIMSFYYVVSPHCGGSYVHSN